MIPNWLNNNNKGRWVCYAEPNTGRCKYGRIKSWNDKYVFVVYACDNDWDEYQAYTAAATKYEDLNFCEEREVIKP